MYKILMTRSRIVHYEVWFYEAPTTEDLEDLKKVWHQPEEDLVVVEIEGTNV